MARETEKLTALAVKNLKPGLHADGKGLYVKVTEDTTRSWVFRYMLNGKARAMGLGPVNDVSLAEARGAAADCRKLLLKGIDPIETRRAERAAKIASAALEAAKAKTFADCAAGYIAANEAAWKNAKHRQQWENTLETYVAPVIGRLPVGSIDTALVLDVLRPIWSTKPETAGRVRGRIEAVLDWAKVAGYRQGENPARWKGHLQLSLPARRKVKKVEHHAALPYDQIGEFMNAIRAQGGAVALAFEFMILTATRTSETIGAKWSEIDPAAKTWTIPAERMKAGREH